jgi:thioredoxin-related protein
MTVYVPFPFRSSSPLSPSPHSLSPIPPLPNPYIRPIRNVAGPPFQVGSLPTLMPRLRLAALAALALLAFGRPATAQGTDASIIPADAPNWLPMGEAIQAARADTSVLMVHLYATWCGWCARLDADVYSDDAIQEYLGEHFQVTRVNIESDEVVPFFGRDVPMTDLASAFEVEGTPTIVFFTAGGHYITKLPGFSPADQFYLVLRYVNERGYEMMPFQDWIQMNSGAPTRDAAGG